MTISPPVSPPGLHSHKQSFQEDDHPDGGSSEESWSKVEAVTAANDASTERVQGDQGCASARARDEKFERLGGGTAEEFPSRVVATGDEDEENDDDDDQKGNKAGVASPHFAADDVVEPSPVSSPPPVARSVASLSFPQLPSSRLTYSPSPLKLALPSGSENNDADAGFANVIRDRTRQRRANDDAALANLRVQVKRLEAALLAESKRRVAAVRSLRDQSVVAVADMEARLQRQVADDTGRVHERLNLLDQRMSALEERWNEDVGGIKDDIEHHSQQLKVQLQALQEAAAHERQQKQQREQRLLQQVQEVAAVYEERWQQERQDRMAAVSALHETMDAVHSTRQSGVVTFEGRMQSELENLTVAVAAEQQERHASDEEIVNSLNRYTRYVQESLAAAVTGGDGY